MWTIALKAPQTKKTIFMSVNNDDKWHHTNDVNNLLAQLFDKHSWTHFILYNDDPPLVNVNNGKAHSKGVILWNDNKVGWLIHSIPNWPMSVKPLSIIPDSSLRYAQSFIFVETPVLLLSSIFCQLSVMDINIYESSDHSYNMFKSKYRKPDSKVLEIDEMVLHFAKAKEWDKDLFDDFLFPKFGGGYVETWMRPLQNDTKGMNNLSVICWDDGTTYKISEDHSKYAFSINKTYPWVYIGDINHMESQSHRGGGGMLIKHNKNVWNAFMSLIAET